MRDNKELCFALIIKIVFFYLCYLAYLGLDEIQFEYEKSKDKSQKIAKLTKDKKHVLRGTF